jgi:hypothetical protein
MKVLIKMRIRGPFRLSCNIYSRNWVDSTKVHSRKIQHYSYGSFGNTNKTVCRLTGNVGTTTGNPGFTVHTFSVKQGCMNWGNHNLDDN